MGLRKYKAKRDFRITPEPPAKRGASASGRSFVIQKHDATRMHYDFRLEMDGVLASWAVPKGPPFGRGEKHLAVHVEDHPLTYGGFEGIIPEGQYGGGTVMLWDRGTYSTAQDPVQAIRKGKIDVTLRGKKLTGDWTLVRASGLSGKDAWLMIRRGEGMRPISKKQDDLSAASGRTMKQIAARKDAVWQSKPAGRRKRLPAPKAARSRTLSRPRPRLDAELRGLPRAAASFYDPMKARLVEELPEGKNWVYEIKFDGVRVIAVKDSESVQLFSRNRIDRAARYASIAGAVGALPASSAVLDGEIVALDEKGRSSFQLLQESLDASRPREGLLVYLFDALQLEGRDLRGLPLVERKRRLEALLRGAADPIRYSAHVEGKAGEVRKQVERLNLEGIIAKRAASKYESGQRTGAWSKWKTHLRQEFVIGGYTPPRGSRTSFGALLVGYFEKGKLRFASRVGTGFTVKTLRSLHRLFQAGRAPTCPFESLPVGGPYGLARAEMRSTQWLQPKWVCEIRFSEWTRDGHLRHPVFLGLREDKKAAGVRRERPAKPPA